jgi:plastocyanin
MKNICFAALLFPFAACAADADYTLVIEGHRFQPAELAIPAGKKVKLQIENHDASAEEFDSFALNREKVISGRGSATLYIGPLDAGRYSFTGEFNAATAQGVVVVQ